MREKIQLNLSFTIVFIIIEMFSSCKSSFPAAGIAVECKGQFVRPILNPTKRASFPGGPQAMSKFLKDNMHWSYSAFVNINFEPSRTSNAP